MRTLLLSYTGSSTSCQYMCLIKNLQTLPQMITNEYIPKTCYEQCHRPLCLLLSKKATTHSFGSTNQSTKFLWASGWNDKIHRNSTSYL